MTEWADQVFDGWIPVSEEVRDRKGRVRRVRFAWIHPRILTSRPWTPETFRQLLEDLRGPAKVAS